MPRISDSQGNEAKLNSDGSLNTKLVGSLANTKVIQNNVSTTGNGLTVDVAGLATVLFDVQGAFSATITFEGSTDDISWNALDVIKIGSNGSAINPAVSTGLYAANVIGLKSVRARVTWITGTSITITAISVANGRLNTGGKITKKITLANAVAITDTTTRVYDLITHGGMTEAEIRQYSTFKITYANSHDQTGTASVLDAVPATNVLTSVNASAMLYTASGNLPATNGRLVLSSQAGGVGGATIAIPALKDVRSNLICRLAFAVAPTSGAATITVEMQ